MKKKFFKISHKEVAMSLSDKILIIISSSLTLVVVGVVLLAGFEVEQILLVGGSIYTLGFFLTFGVSRSFSRRMLDLIRQIEEMAAGNLSTRLQVNSRDEIGQLARAVNDLT